MDNPRRQAAESLRERRDWELLLPVTTFVAFTGGSLTMALVAWLLSRFNDSWAWYAIAVSLGLFGIALWRFFTVPKKAVIWNRGIRGERAVADALEHLRASGYHIFHDLPDSTSAGQPCNIDHVVAGPEGVFVIETKFRSKVAGQENHVEVTPQAVLVNGRPVEKDPRGQARAGAESVRRRLTDRLGWEPHVKPVVVLPTWFTRAGFGDGPWVLNEKALVKALSVPRYQRLAGAKLNQAVTELDAWSRQPHP